MAYAATKDLLRIWQREGVIGARKALYDLSMPLFETEDVQQALRAAADAMNTGTPYPKAIFSSGREVVQARFLSKRNRTGDRVG
jgi:hypothetical protein